MMRPDAKVEKVYLYPKPVDFRKSIDGLAALVERKRSINPTWLKIGKALSCEVEVRSSTAARLRNPQPKSP
ncbi:IS66 family insertion sequence element accessory protein TnpB, partial [Pseudomonas viridiflava]|uniref:IS66 family insertion sequence element accessory protein TnpB n=3 Tax=Pseudomonas viridiflava TaxID=33069 RepID=UPI001F1226C1